MVTLMSRCPATSWAVWRHAVHDRVGDQDATEVVRDETQRPAAGVGESGPGEGVGDEFADRGSCYRAVLAAVATLEQQRDRRARNKAGPTDSPLEVARSDRNHSTPAPKTVRGADRAGLTPARSEEHTSELQS